MRGETEETRKERRKGILGIQSCKVLKMVYVGKFENNIITLYIYSNKWMPRKIESYQYKSIQSILIQSIMIQSYHHK